MDRRGFAKLLGLGAATIIVPQFGRFYREGQGKLFTPPAFLPPENFTLKLLVDRSMIEGDNYLKLMAPSFKKNYYKIFDNMQSAMDYARDFQQTQFDCAVDITLKPSLIPRLQHSNLKFTGVSSV